jgi:hypothetical protein
MPAERFLPKPVTIFWQDSHFFLLALIERRRSNTPGAIQHSAET